MGGAASVVRQECAYRLNEDDSSCKNSINIADARELYVAEGSIYSDCSEEQLECRILLDESIGYSYLEAFVAHDDVKNKMLKRWKMLISKKKALNNQFAKVVDAVCSVSDTLSDVRKSSNKKVLAELGMELMVCFDQIFSQLFIHFKKSDEYLIMCYELNKKNSACAEDFDYFTNLGAGAFGCVFSCRKRSTGRMYAMKVQPKASLLWSAHGKPEDVMIELLASTGCPSPFLAQAQYAFQTAKLVFLALPLYAYGDLRRALKLAPQGYFSRARAQFYAAELASALIFLHDNGLMHRDLKPENVFIDGTGHIVLGDLGSVADENKRLQPVSAGPKPLDWKCAYVRSSSNNLSVDSDPQRLLSTLTTSSFNIDASSPKVDNNTPFRSSLFSPTNGQQSGTDNYSPYISVERDKDSFGSSTSSYSYAFEIRPNGIVGTMRYMAPEVLALFADKEGLTKIRGCTPALDWFSYGVMVHEMLTGKCPFNPARNMTYAKLAQTYPSYLALANYDIDAAHTTVMGPFDCSEQDLTLLGPDGLAFVAELVELNSLKRLGLNKHSFPVAGADVYSEFKANPFFEGVDWEAVSERAMTPPSTYEALPPILVNTNRVFTCSAILQRSCKPHWQDCIECTANITANSGMNSSERCYHRKMVTAAKQLVLNEKEQVYFKNWYFTHPSVVSTKRDQ